MSWDKYFFKSKKKCGKIAIRKDISDFLITFYSAMGEKLFKSNQFELLYWLV